MVRSNNAIKKTVEFFPSHKKETDLAIGATASTPLPDHPFCAGCRLSNDPIHQADPTAPRSSNPVSEEKAPSFIFNHDIPFPKWCINLFPVFVGTIEVDDIDH